MTYPGTMNAEVISPQAPLLTEMDRCDRCPAQAYVRVRLIAGGELMFCGHHWRIHGDSVRERAADVVDETKKLLK